MSKIKNNEQLYYSKMPSPIGELYIVSTKEKLISISNDYSLKGRLNSFLKDKINQETKVIKDTKVQLKNYFSGKLKTFSLPIEFNGTKFQNKVWNELNKIPYGKTVSYKDISNKIKHPNSYRAVGTAVGKNPLMVILPCHRVIGATGNIMTGFGGGLSAKQSLLKLEDYI